jgi:hypothetical protein
MLCIFIISMFAFSPNIHASDLEKDLINKIVISKINRELQKRGETPINRQDYIQMVGQAIHLAVQKGNDLETQSGNYAIIVPINDDADLYGTIKLVSVESDRINTNSTKPNYLAKDWSKSLYYNPNPMVNWGLHNKGTFTYGKNSRGYAIVNGVSATVDAAASFPYSASDYKSIERLDDSVVRIIGKGTYSLVPSFGTLVFHGYLDVEVNGTGDVRILRGFFDY